MCVILAYRAEKIVGTELGSEEEDCLFLPPPSSLSRDGISSKQLSFAERRERPLHFTMDKEGSFVEFCMAWGPKYATDEKT